MSLSKLESEALSAGYFRSPNDPVRWYAGGPNLPELCHPFDVHVTDAVWVVVRPYGKAFETVPVLRFDTFAEFLDYCRRNGRKSEGGSAGNSTTNVLD